MKKVISLLSHLTIGLELSKLDTLNNHKKICVNCRGKNWLIQCKCGKCSELIFMIGREGKPRKYKYRHHAKGKNNGHWKGGITWFGDYLYISKPDHHFANNHGCIALHRHMYEYYYGCCLLSYIDIHHINGKTTDNHKKNLMPVTGSEHNKIHKIKDMSDRICLICKSKNTYFNKKHKYYYWHRYKNGFVCRKCYNRIRYKKLL